MFKVIRSKKTKMFYSFKEKGWVEKAKDGTLYRKFNPIRFIAKWYIENKYEPVIFHNVVFLKANINMPESTPEITNGNK